MDTNPTQSQQANEPTLDESITQVMRTLPGPVREYLVQRKYSAATSRFMTKYGLHVDQGGILERELMLLLMGVENPDEFAASLKGEGMLSEDIVRSIMTDVNQEVFVPLQNQIRQGGPEAVKPAAPTPRPVPPAPSYGMPAPAPTPRPVPSTPISMPRPQVPPRPASVTMAQTKPAPVMQAPKPPVPQTPPAPRPSNVAPLPPKMAMPKVFMPGSNARPVRPMLPVGEEEFTAFRVHKTAPPPVNLPGAQMPPAPPPAQPRPPTPHEAPPISLTPKPSAPPATPAKPYTVDPYREPVE